MTNKGTGNGKNSGKSCDKDGGCIGPPGVWVAIQNGILERFAKT